MIASLPSVRRWNRRRYFTCRRYSSKQRLAATTRTQFSRLPSSSQASKSGPVSGAAEKVDADLLRQVSMMTEALRNRTNQATATIDDQMKERFLAAAADAAHEFRIRQGLKRGRLPLIIGRNATGFSRHRLQPALKTDQHAKQHTDAATANFVRVSFRALWSGSRGDAMKF